MDGFSFDIQRFAVMPTLVSGGGDDRTRYWNTIPGAVVAGFGNTFFVNHGKGCIIQCEDASTFVYNDTIAPGVKINGADGSDRLINDAVKVTINGNGGSDDILNHAGNVKIYGGTGDDIIQNHGGSKVTIDAGANNDHIDNDGSKVTIAGGKGNDSVENRGSNVSIDGGKNDDYIYNFGTKVTIIAGASDDHIGNNNSSVSINAGKGNDSIYNDSGSVKVTRRTTISAIIFTTRARTSQSLRARATIQSATDIPTLNTKALPSRLTRATAKIR